MEKLKATHYRLGNFVHYEARLAEIIQIGDLSNPDSIIAKSYRWTIPENFTEDLMPIPISEEWLQVFSFKTDAFGVHYKLKLDNERVLIMYIDSSDILKTQINQYMDVNG